MYVYAVIMVAVLTVEGPEMYVYAVLTVEGPEMYVYAVIMVAAFTVEGPEICARCGRGGSIHSRGTHPRCPPTEKQGAASLTSHTEGLCPRILAETSSPCDSIWR